MKRISLTAALCLLFVSATAWPDSQADAIMRASYALPQPKTMAATAYMLLVESNGAQSLRALTMDTRTAADGTDSYIEFLSPPDVKGTKFLSLAAPGGSDVQRLWLPALKRVRRIAASGEGEKFVGSDLTYYDMRTHRFADARYAMAGEETLDVQRNGESRKVACWIIDSTPENPAVPYGRVRLWVGKDENFVYRSTMWDSRGNELKTVYILEVKGIDGIVVPIRTGVIAADGHKTLLQMNDVRVNQPIDPALFSVSQLER